MWRRVFLVIIWGICIFGALSFKKGSIRVLHWGTLSPFPTEFDPILVSTGAGVTIAHLIFDPLFDVVGDSYFPNLVTHWQLLDKGRVCRLYLKKGVFFHNGVEMKADDVLYSFKLLKRKAKDHCVIEKRLATISYMRKVGDYCIDVVYRKPKNEPDFSVLNFPVLPKSVYCDPKKKDYVKYHPIGTGPYIFRGFVSHRKVVLDANPNYFQGEPLIKRIEITSYNSKLALFNAILKGDIDIALCIPSRTYNALSHLDDVRVIKQRLDYYYAILYDFSDSSFSDERVRKAIAMSVNWRDFSKLNCFGKRAEGPFEMRFFQSLTNDISYNPQKVKRLLSSAGWVRKEDFWYKGGKVLEIKLFVPKVYSYDRRWLMLLRQQLNKAGIKLTLKTEKKDVNAYLVMMYGGKNLKEVIFWWLLLRCKDTIVSGIDFLPRPVMNMLNKTIESNGNVKLLRNIYRRLYYKQLIWFLFYPICCDVISKDIICLDNDKCNWLLLNTKRGLLSMSWRKLKERR